MKKYILLPLLLLTGCAQYNAVALSHISPDIIHEAPQHDGMIVAAKALNRSECRRYLDRDVIRKGYQPVQIYLENVSDKTYLFALNRISLPSASPEEVAKKMHTSTAGRIASYGAAALIASPLFAVPAVVDGYRSYRANEGLSSDYQVKCAKDQVIYPHSHANMLLFVPKENYQKKFTIIFLDEETNRPLKVMAEAR